VKSFKTMKRWSSTAKAPKNGYILGALTDIDNDIIRSKYKSNQPAPVAFVLKHPIW